MFIDLSKAFDTIRRIGLFAKLLKYEIGGKFYNIIKNMYNRVNCCGKTYSGFSQFFQSNLGVKQVRYHVNKYYRIDIFNGCESSYANV